MPKLSKEKLTEKLKSVKAERTLINKEINKLYKKEYQLSKTEVDLTEKIRELGFSKIKIAKGLCYLQDKRNCFSHHDNIWTIIYIEDVKEQTCLSIYQGKTITRTSVDIVKYIKRTDDNDQRFIITKSSLSKSTLQGEIEDGNFKLIDEDLAYKLITEELGSNIKQENNKSCVN
jgi:hypothetical protein